MKLFRFIFKEIINNRSFSLLFILNLSMGLTGFIALDSFKTAVDQTLKQRSKSILGADFGLSARRPISEAEIKYVHKATDGQYEESKMIEIFSMVANQDGLSRLIQIKAVEANYPFYGDIILQDQSIAKTKNLEGRNLAWVYPEILLQLKVSIGDAIKLGAANFTIVGVIENDSAAGISTNMAPRVYIGFNQLSSTELLSAGSIAWHSYVYKLPQKTSSELEELKQSVYEQIDSPNIQVYTHENSSEQVGRLLSYLNDFLGLASLVALFLASVGSGFLFRSYFINKLKEIAILVSLGTTHAQAFTLYIMQIIFLGILSSVLAFSFSWVLALGLSAITAELLPFEIDFSLSLSSLLVGLGLGAFGSLFICLPILTQIINIKPAILLNSKNTTNYKLGFKGLIATLPGLFVFWLLAIFLSHSLRTGSLFTGVFFAAGCLLALIAIGLFWLLPFIRTKNLGLHWALRDIYRNKLSSVSAFLCIGLGMLLLNLIPQLEASLNEELKSPEQSKIPSLFLFDIQEEQVDILKEVTDTNQFQISQLSPMIRARLLAVNDKTFDKGKGRGSKNLSREEEREMRFRNRGFNLSYRSKPLASENIIKGTSSSGTYNEADGKLPEISLEKRFADRLDLQIGDTMTFDIQSIEIKGKVINFRSVKWTSFQPNFFIQFQPGVLDLAPKTFLATLANLPIAKKIEIQNKIVEKLPNVSIIDITRLVERLRGIMTQMSWALKLMAVLCIFAGFIVIYSIANYQAKNRRWDIGLLKSLGADFKDIKGQFRWQYSIISILAGSFGILISLAVSYMLSSLLFDGLWIFNLTVPIASLIACCVLTILITDFASRNALKTKTRDLFIQR